MSPSDAEVAALFADFDRPDSPGAAVAVARDGKVVASHCFGQASIEHSVPITRETVFYIASTSKQFVAASIAMLEADGRLSIDDEVITHVPEIHRFSPPLTIRHLLHHTSGLRDKYALAAVGGLREESYSTDEGSLELLAAQRELNFEPGSRFMYSNSNYFLLAQIVARVSGQSFPSFTQERIFGPLGMTRTRFRDDTSVVIANRASGYTKKADGEWHVAEYTLNSLGPGGVVTTVDDLALWSTTFFANKLQPLDLLERMLRTRPLTDGSPNPYALGLMVDNFRGVRAISHAGGVEGFGAELVHFPDHNLSVMCLANTPSMNAALKARRVAELWLGDALDDAGPAAVRATPEPVDAAGAAEVDLDLCAGKYLSQDETAIYRVEVDDGKPVLVVGGQRMPLEAVGRTSLRTPPGTVLAFDDAGFEVVRMPGMASSAPLRFARLAPFDPAAPLAEYAGRYRSDELDAAVEVRADADGSLSAVLPQSGVAEVTPVAPDLFLANDTLLRVVRDDGGAVSGLQISIDRALKNRFDRIS